MQNVAGDKNVTKRKKTEKSYKRIKFFKKGIKEIRMLNVLLWELRRWLNMLLETGGKVILVMNW